MESREAPLIHQAKLESTPQIWESDVHQQPLDSIEAWNGGHADGDAPEGYHELTEDLLGPYPELAHFRRFGSLNMLNLLSLQAELTHLKVRFDAIASRDDKAHNYNTTSRYSKSFRAMLVFPPEKRPEQWKLLLEIRAKLNEYSM